MMAEEHLAIGGVRFAPDMVLERFGNQALILLAWHDRMLTIDQAAIDIVELVQAELKEAHWTTKDLADLLDRHYELTAQEADVEADSLVDAWLEQGILAPSEAHGGAVRRVPAADAPVAAKLEDDY
jgi:hypothetical protein